MPKPKVNEQSEIALVQLPEEQCREAAGIYPYISRSYAHLAKINRPFIRNAGKQESWEEELEEIRSDEHFEAI